MFHIISTDKVNNATLGHIFKMSRSTGVMLVKQMIVSTYSYGLQIEEYIDQRLSELDTEYEPKIRVEEKTNTTFFTCYFQKEVPKLKQQRYFKEYIILPIAKAMVDVIQNHFAIDYGNQIIQTNYDFGEIMITVILENDLENQQLLDPIINEMLECHIFCLDGWIDFRLSKYKTYIIDVVDNLICEYKAYKEYEEFITLLKEYTLSQEPLIDQVHIIPSYNGKINLYNKKYDQVTKIGQGEHDDLILGTLLSLAPLRIIIHNKEKCKNLGLIKTITSIYRHKIVQCKGCQYCKKLGCNKGMFRVIKDMLTQKKL